MTLDALGDLEPEDRNAFVRAMSRRLDSDIKINVWKPEPHQIAPPGRWRGWALFGGRGIGKTAAGANHMIAHVKGPPCLTGPHPHLMGIIAPTQSDAVTSCVEGATGIRRYDSSARIITGREGTLVKWPNGSQAKMYGTNTEEACDSLRSGGNTCLVWAEELAAWRWLDYAWSMMIMGLRETPNAHWIATTTPRPRELIKKIDKGQLAGVVRTHARTSDNPHLSAEFLETVTGMYGGTALGEQELEGRIVEQTAHALWQRAQIAKYRIDVNAFPLDLLQRRIVGVDPSGGAGKQGIVVIGFSKRGWDDGPTFEGEPLYKTPLHRGFVLADYTCRKDPAGWGKQVIDAAMDWDADGIVFESDYGRDMPKSVIVGAANAAGLLIPIEPALARAIGNKRARAFPVSSMAARGRYPHVGTHEELEDELCTWEDSSDADSPDRMDAMVWPAWHEKLVSTVANTMGRLPGKSVAGRSLTGWRG